MQFLKELPVTNARHLTVVWYAFTGKLVMKSPGTILPVKACFLAILDKEVRFGRYEYKWKVKPSNSRFKLFPDTIILRVKAYEIAIKTAKFQ
jgi:hypothetical protein